MTLEEFHTRLVELHPQCSYRLYLNGTLRWTPMHTFQWKAIRNPSFHQEPARKIQEATYALYFKQDFFNRDEEEVKYDAVNLDALLLNVMIESSLEIGVG